MKLQDVRCVEEAWVASAAHMQKQVNSSYCAAPTAVSRPAGSRGADSFQAAEVPTAGTLTTHSPKGAEAPTPGPQDAAAEHREAPSPGEAPTPGPKQGIS